MTALIGLLIRHDERVLLAVVRRRLKLADRLMEWVTHLGGATLTIAVASGLSLGLVAGMEQTGKEIASLLILSHLGVQLLKRTVTRPRPCLPVGPSSLIQAPDRFSFPSGHAAASLSLALPLAAAAPPYIGAFVLTLAGVVGFSRCYLGVHYPGDVIAGWLLVATAHWTFAYWLPWI
jgi:undecaprenyl-diphosphatase